MECSRLRWFGHVESMNDNNWVKKCRVIEVEGSRGRGRPKKTWEQVVATDLHKLGISRATAQDRNNWRKTIMMNSLTHASVD